MRDVRADAGTYDDLLDWVAFCVNFAMPAWSPKKIARALREIAEECDSTPDVRFKPDNGMCLWERVEDD